MANSTVNFITPAVFEDENFVYKGTPDEIKQQIKDDLVLHVINSRYEGYNGNLRTGIENMAKVLTKEEFDKTYKDAIEFSESLKN